MLVASMTGSAAAAEQLDGGVNTDADAAHNSYIDGDVTKAVHEMGWSATEYENNNGEVTSLPAEINDTVTNPYGFEASEIETSAYGAFPRDGVRTESDGKAGAVRDNGWAEDEAGTAGSGTISNVTTTSGVEAVEISTSSQAAGDNYRATFDAYKITSDAEKRYVQLVLDVSTLDSGADVDITFNDTDGDYVEAHIDPDDNYDAQGVIANSTGDGYVFQEQVGEMTVAGTGDGTMQEINETTISVQDANAEIEIAALNVEKLGAWDFGDRMEDTDGDGDNETRTVRDINTSGDYGVTDPSTMGSAFDAATIHDLTLPIKAWASMMDLDDRDTRFANVTNATAFASFDKRLDDYRALKLPTAYDLSYSNLELRDTVAVPANRYQTVEYATAVGVTQIKPQLDPDRGAGDIRARVTDHLRGTRGVRAMIEALAPLQPTPAVPDATGGGTSPLAILTVVAAVGYVVQTRTSIDLLGLVPSVGGSGGGGSGDSSSSGSGGDGGLLGFVTSINGVAIGGLTLLAALILGGAIEVPTGTGVPFVVALELVAAALILEELGGLNVQLFGLVVLGTVLLGLSALGEPVLAILASSPAFPIIAIGRLYVAYRAMTQDSSRTIVVRGEVEDGGDQ